MAVTRDVFSNGAIAHASLKGIAKADRYTDGVMKRVTHPVARLRLQHDSPATDRQILYGHQMCQLEPYQGLSRDETTGYVGYVADHELASWTEPTHRVSARATLLFDTPDFKTPGPTALSAGSLLRVIEQDGKWARTHDGRYAPVNHLTDLDFLQPDLAATAENLLNTPYLWGGNSAFGIDCSGLIQLACQAAQIPCPGDSDQQMAQLGTDLDDGSTPKRNDLMFWKGHVALLAAPDMLIHANAGAMCVAYEPLDAAIRRIEVAGEGSVLAHKRL